MRAAAQPSSAPAAHFFSILTINSVWKLTLRKPTDHTSAKPCIAHMDTRFCNQTRGKPGAIIFVERWRWSMAQGNRQTSQRVKLSTIACACGAELWVNLWPLPTRQLHRSEEHTSELQSLR